MVGPLAGAKVGMHHDVSGNYSKHIMFLLLRSVLFPTGFWPPIFRSTEARIALRGTAIEGLGCHLFHGEISLDLTAWRHKKEQVGWAGELICRGPWFQTHRSNPLIGYYIKTYKDKKLLIDHDKSMSHLWSNRQRYHIFVDLVDIWDTWCIDS